MIKYNKFLENKTLNYNYVPWIIHDNIYTDDIDIMCFPCVMFDPVWILHDTKSKSKYSKLNNLDNFFKETDEDINTFFDNQIFSYHWHSRSNAIIEKNSYFEKLEK